MPLDEQAALREWWSPLEMSSNAAVVLLDVGLCCCWCCGEFRRWDVGKGQFVFYNPMDAVMALQRNVVMGKCWGQANRERKEMGLDWTGRGASWDAAQFSAVYLLTVPFVLSPCQDCWECVAAAPQPGNSFSLNSPPSNYSPCNPNVPFAQNFSPIRWNRSLHRATLQSDKRPFSWLGCTAGSSGWKMVSWWRAGETGRGCGSFHLDPTQARLLMTFVPS